LDVPDFHRLNGDRVTKANVAIPGAVPTVAQSEHFGGGSFGGAIGGAENGAHKRIWIFGIAHLGITEI